MQIRKSAEDYLEAILMLSKQGSAVRSIDIATMLGVSKPSVSHAMKLLREDGYIAMDRYGTVTLLDKGAEIANHIYERHRVLSSLLERLGVNPEVPERMRVSWSMISVMRVLIKSRNIF